MDQSFHDLREALRDRSTIALDREFLQIIDARPFWAALPLAECAEDSSTDVAAVHPAGAPPRLLLRSAAALVMKFASPAQSGLAAMDVTIRRPWVAGPDPAYAGQFIAAVKRLRGVIYCAQVAHDYERRTLTFRVVYLADALPEGLLNRLASLPDLRIKPRN